MVLKHIFCSNDAEALLSLTICVCKNNKTKREKSTSTHKKNVLTQVNFLFLANRHLNDSVRKNTHELLHLKRDAPIT